MNVQAAIIEYIAYTALLVIVTTFAIHAYETFKKEVK